MTDPTFDEAGEHGYLTKTAAPAAHEDELGPVDAVLVSHDLHPDNLDVRGRAFALASSLVLTGPASARRLGPPARGLAAWESVELPRPGGDTVTVHAVPAQHGPDDGERDEQGHVNCEVTGFILSGAGLPTVYISGDNASVGVVAEIARRMPPMDTDMADYVPESDKVDPVKVAGLALDGIQARALEVIADDKSRAARAALSGDLANLYPGLPTGH